MQPIALARALANHHATQRPAPAPARQERPAAKMPNPVLAAIARQSRSGARTMLEMAREREGFSHAWW